MTLRFTREHEWIAVTDDEGIVGITDFAQQQLGDVVYVELPEVGSRLVRGAQAAVVESVKAASEVYAPVSGEVVAVNAELAEDPARVNADAMGEGWFFKVRLDDPAELGALLDEETYKQHTEALH